MCLYNFEQGVYVYVCEGQCIHVQIVESRVSRCICRVYRCVCTYCEEQDV